MDDSLDHWESLLRNRRILVVEDEASTVIMAEIALTEAGCRVYLAQDLPRAHKIATTKRVDCALLDIGIGDDTIIPVADILAAKKVPLVFASGYDNGALPERYRSNIILAKPYLFSDLVQALVVAMSSMGSAP